MPRTRGGRGGAGPAYDLAMAWTLQNWPVICYLYIHTPRDQSWSSSSCLTLCLTYQWRIFTHNLQFQIAQNSNGSLNKVLSRLYRLFNYHWRSAIVLVYRFAILHNGHAGSFNANNHKQVFCSPSCPACTSRGTINNILVTKDLVVIHLSIINTNLDNKVTVSLPHRVLYSWNMLTSY